MKDNSLARSVLKNYRNTRKALTQFCNDHHVFCCGVDDKFRLQDLWEYIGLNMLLKQLKERLSKLPNIPNKKEAKEIRRERAKRR